MSCMRTVSRREEVCLARLSREYFGGTEAEAKQPQSSDGRPPLKKKPQQNTFCSRSPSLTLGCLPRHHKAFNSHSTVRNGGGLYLPSSSIITQKTLHVGNGRSSGKEMSDSMHPYETQTNVKVVEIGGYYFLLQYNIQKRVCVSMVQPSLRTQHTLTLQVHAAVLYNWIKRETTVPQNKRAV